MGWFAAELQKIAAAIAVGDLLREGADRGRENAASE